MNQTPPALRAKEILAKMTLEEKMYQLSAQMLWDVKEDYEDKRNHKEGNYRNPGHFMHFDRPEPATPAEVAERINRDVRLTMEAHPNPIPPIEHGEALHGAQWGMATCFPQPIAMASSFDDDLVSDIADVIGKELAVVGVRQALTPVVNVSRDCRWGRTVETFGEDVLLSSNMGKAICKSLSKNRSGCGAVTCGIIGFYRNLFYKLCAHIFKSVFKFNFLSYGYTVVSNKG